MQSVTGDKMQGQNSVMRMGERDASCGKITLIYLFWTLALQLLYRFEGRDV